MVKPHDLFYFLEKNALNRHGAKGRQGIGRERGGGGWRAGLCCSVQGNGGGEGAKSLKSVKV